MIRIWALMRKEASVLFGSPIAYGVLFMVALVTGPIFYVLRGVGRGVDRTMRSARGALGSALKLSLFLFLLALIGAVLTLFALLLYEANA